MPHQMLSCVARRGWDGKPLCRVDSTKSAHFRSDAIQRLLAGPASEQRVTSMPDIESLRAAKCHLAMDLVAHGNNLQGFCHAVERTPPAGRGAPEKFAPILFVFRNKLTRDDKVVIAFDGLALSEILGRTVEVGKVVYFRGF